MPTLLSHPAFPLAVGLGLGPKMVRKPLLLAGVVVSMLPDLDVIAFPLGIPYAAEWGHRGFSHSMVFAGLVALLGAWFFSRFRGAFAVSFGFLFFSMASHGFLDAFTTGGQGIALLWPFTPHRYFAPVQVIRVSPLSFTRFLSPRGIEVLRSELLWVWLPSGALAAVLALCRRCFSRTKREHSICKN